MKTQKYDYRNTKQYQITKLKSKNMEFFKTQKINNKKQYNIKAYI